MFARLIRIHGAWWCVDFLFITVSPLHRAVPTTLMFYPFLSFMIFILSIRLVDLGLTDDALPLFIFLHRVSSLDKHI